MKTETLDVREDLRRGLAPFDKIMAAAAKVAAGETLVLVAPFEPLPLFKVLEQQGFTHAAQQTRDGDWEVRFTRSGRVQPKIASSIISKSAPCRDASSVQVEAIELDARGLQPPQPLVTILEALATLPGNAELHARTDRRPMHLYAELETRGFTGDTQEQEDGSFITHIRRA